MSYLHFIKLFRVNNYIKNLIIFFPLFLNYEYWNFENYEKLFFSFIFFSLIASSVYIINDVLDLETDKKNKIKKLRPIASGVIKPKQAILFLNFIINNFINIFFHLFKYKYFFASPYILYN